MPAPHHRVRDAHTSCLCRDWFTHTSRTMSVIKTNEYDATLDYGLEDHKLGSRIRRSAIRIRPSRIRRSVDPLEARTDRHVY